MLVTSREPPSQTGATTGALLLDETTPEAPATPETPETPAAPASNLEARFAELTAKIHETQRLAAEKDGVINSLTALLSQGTAGNQPQAPQLPEFDETQKPLVAFFEQKLQEQERRFQSHLGQLQGNFGLQQLHQDAQALGVDEAVATRAAALYANWQKQGVAATHQDAVTFALGEQNRAQRVATPPQQRYQGLQAPPAPPQFNQGIPPLPANFESLSPRKQMEILEKRGVDRMS